VPYPVHFKKLTLNRRGGGAAAAPFDKHLRRSHRTQRPLFGNKQKGPAFTIGLYTRFIHKKYVFGVMRAPSLALRKTSAVLRQLFFLFHGKKG